MYPCVVVAGGSIQHTVLVVVGPSLLRLKLFQFHPVFYIYTCISSPLAGVVHAGGQDHPSVRACCCWVVLQ